MTDELDPKLQELESQLRRLKPARRDGRRQTADGRRLRRIIYALVTTAALAFVVVFQIQQPREPATVSPVITDSLPSAVCRLPSNSLRQQLAELLDEMTVADSIAEKQPVYPVVEIAVCQEGGRRQETGVRRWEHARWQMEYLTMF